MYLSGTYEEVMAMINAIGAPIVLVDVDPDDHFSGFGLNSLAEEYFGFSNERYRGLNIEDLRGLSGDQRLIAQRAMSSYRRCIEVGLQITTEDVEIKPEDGTSRWGRHTIVPLFSKSGAIRQLMITSIDITELKETQEKLEIALTRLLSGFVHICATCKNIRDESENWVRVEQYMANHSDDVQFSHGYCPKCYESAIQELK